MQQLWGQLLTKRDGWVVAAGLLVPVGLPRERASPRIGSTTIAIMTDSTTCSVAPQDLAGYDGGCDMRRVAIPERRHSRGKGPVVPLSGVSPRLEAWEPVPFRRGSASQCRRAGRDEEGGNRRDTDRHRVPPPPLLAAPSIQCLPRPRLTTTMPLPLPLPLPPLRLSSLLSVPSSPSTSPSLSPSSLNHIHRPGELIDSASRPPLHHH